MFNCLKRVGAIKADTCVELFGCARPELMIHLQSTFQPWMDWSNYGKWHVDHIKPLSRFRLLEEPEQRKAFNFKNLQALWGPDNIRKSDKYEETNINA
jgi:hypothetical protein